jgi:hypothetical protein
VGSNVTKTCPIIRLLEFSCWRCDNWPKRQSPEQHLANNLKQQPTLKIPLRLHFIPRLFRPIVILEVLLHLADNHDTNGKTVNVQKIMVVHCCLELEIVVYMQGTLTEGEGSAQLTSSLG